MLNRDSRSRSAVGRIACERGDASVRPPRRPPTMRISFSCGGSGGGASRAAPAPAHPGARPRPLGLAISDRTRLRTMDRDRFLRRSRRGNRPGKVGACERSDPLAELLAQMAGAHLHYFALRQIAELERPE